MSLTIVITSYNRSSVLKRLLESLEMQIDMDFQVVVAVDGSTDGTEEMLDKQSTNYDLKWINTHCKGYGLAVARNMGILAADGKAVVILDDDSFPDVGFVAAHKRSVLKGTITGGPRRPSNPSDERLVWKMRELGKLPSCSPVKIDELKRDWPHAYLIENNTCLLKQDWIDIGLFSERLKMYGFIGQEFFARAEYLGFSYQYNPDASVVHYGQYEGDNGILRSRKHRHIKVANALRPFLERPSEFHAQVKWARCLAESPTRPNPLGIPLLIWLRLPEKLIRNEISSAQKGLLRAMRD